LPHLAQAGFVLFFMFTLAFFGTETFRLENLYPAVLAIGDSKERQRSLVSL